MPPKSLMLGIIGFCALAYPGIYFAIIGDVPVARTLIELSMIPGYTGFIWTVIVSILAWWARRNDPRCLG